MAIANEVPDQGPKPVPFRRTEVMECSEQSDALDALLDSVQSPLDDLEVGPPLQRTDPLLQGIDPKLGNPIE